VSELTFMMGKFPAELRSELRYCRNHMWCRADENGRHRFGFTSYAIRLMQDVYFLEWSINVGDTLRLKQQMGNIESSKAQSDLYAPVAGVVVAFNEEVLKDPSAINVDGYGGGWLFEMEADLTSTMDAQGYHEFLASGWENTQRILKGQMGD